MTDKARILIVDDHPIVCEGLAQLINQETDLTVVGEAHEATEAMKKIGELNPDLAIVDISLVGKSGIELTAEIRTHHPGLPVLALSMHTERLYVERALNAGARGYVAKSDATAVITNAIRKVLSGRIYLSDGMSEKLLDSLYGGPHERGQMAIERLSDREFEVFSLIGRGMKNHQIAELFGVSVKTIDAHREHIKEKLQIKDSHELYGYALQWSKSSDLGKPPTGNKKGQ